MNPETLMKIAELRDVVISSDELSAFEQSDGWLALRQQLAHQLAAGFHALVDGTAKDRSDAAIRQEIGKMEGLYRAMNGIQMMKDCEAANETIQEESGVTEEELADHDVKANEDKNELRVLLSRAAKERE